MDIRSFNNPLILLLTVLVLFGFVGAFNYANSNAGIDYYVFWAAADATKNDTTENIYQRRGQYSLGREYRRIAEELHPDTRRQLAASFKSYLNTTATPFLYWVVGLVSSGDYEKDLTRWTTLSLLFFSLTVLLMGRMLRMPLAMNLLLLLASLVWMEAMRSELRVANVNCVQLGMVMLSLWLLVKDSDLKFAFLGGACTALTVMFKPNLGPIVVLIWGAWLMRGEWKKLMVGTGGMAFGTLFAVVVSSIFFDGIAIWGDWFKNLFGLMYAEMPAQSGNIAASNKVVANLGPKDQLAIMLGWCAVALALFWWGRRRSSGIADSKARRTIEYTQLLAIGCVIQMTVSSVIWLHYYLLLIPMVVVALRPWSNPGQRNMGSIVLHRVLPVIAFILLLDSPLFDFFDMDYVRFLELSTTVVITILLGLGLWQLAMPDAELPGKQAGTQPRGESDG